MKKALISAGFECMTEQKYLTSDVYLLPGDIILSEKHHVIINTSTGSQIGTYAPSGGTVVNKQYAAIVAVNTGSYLNVRTGPGERFAVATLGTDKTPVRLPKGMVLSIDQESSNWGRLTGTGYWVSLAYLKR